MLGVPIKDYFGRDRGKVICYSYDGKGEIRSLLAFTLDGNIEEYKRENVQVSSSEIVIKDDLMVSAHALRKEIEVNIRRMQALDELKDTSRIHPRVYSELKAELEMEKSSLEEKKRELLGMADARRIEVARKLMALEKFRAIIEVQAMSGEISESIYRYASSEIKSAIDKLTNELEALERELSFLDIEIAEIAKEISEVYYNKKMTKDRTINISEQESRKGVVPGKSEMEQTENIASVEKDKPIRVRLV